MLVHRRRNFPGRPTAAAAVTVAVLSAAPSGCSGSDQKREYTLPRSLCGTAIDTDDLANFLPPGKRITVRKKPYSGVKNCEVVVDDKLIVTTTLAWLEEGKTTAYFSAGQSLEAPEHSADAGRFRFSDSEAFGKTQDCVDRRHKQELYTAVQAQGSEHRDADAMKRLIASFTKEIEASEACTAGPLQGK